MMKRLRNYLCLGVAVMAFWACGGDSEENIRIYGGIKNEGRLYLSDHGLYNVAGAVLGNKAYFVGGVTQDAVGNKNYTDKVYVIDSNFGKEETTLGLDTPSTNMVAVSTGNSVYFAGGEILTGVTKVASRDIRVLMNNGRWKSDGSLKLKEARNRFGGAYANGRVFFAGGFTNGRYLKSVDLFNLATAERSNYALVTERADLAVEACGGYVFCAGGINSKGACNEVEIFDTNNSFWVNATSDKLSEARSLLAAGTANDLTVFAGGKNDRGYSNKVDIYNVNTKEWKQDALSEARCGIATTTCGNLILFAGGQKGETSFSKIVDVYDTRKGAFLEPIELREARAFATAVTMGNRVYIVGGLSEDGPSQTVDILLVN